MSLFIQYCIALIVILYQSSVNCQYLPIFTCCKLQHTLDTSGYCDQPTSEFELNSFPTRWEVPEIFLIKNENETQPVFNLESRPSSCFCGRHSFIEIKLEVKGLQGQQWVLRNGEKIEISKDGYLYHKGIMYGRSHYCIDKLSETHLMPWEQYNTEMDLVEINFVICSASCPVSNLPIVPLPPREPVEKRDKSSLTKPDWFKNTHQCIGNVVEGFDSESETNCSHWTSFYYEENNLVLIDYTKNITEIRDHTYPWEFLPPETYCKVSENSQRNLGIVKFCIAEIRKLFYEYQKWYAILAGVSAIFLLFNITIYFALRDSLSISGWTEFLYSLALYIYCVLSIPGLLIVPDSEYVRNDCYVLATLIQFFELASGATLVGLSFDIFWTFCKFDKGSYTDNPKVSTFRLSIYFIFSIAFPLAVVCYGISKNHRPWDFKFDDKTGIPQYGLFHCTAPDWSMSSYTQFAMQGINLFLALISAYVILNKKMSGNAAVRKMISTDEEESFVDPDRMDIFAKLFVFVFIFWILDFMEYFFEGELFTNKWHLVAFHVINYSQGIFAFFILVCNRKTLRGIRNKDWSIRSLFQHACCTCTRGVDEVPSDDAPLSPLMKTGSFRRATVRGNALY